MSCRGCPYFDPEYETLSSRLNAPSVVIDNVSYEDTTLVKVDSVNKHGILLEVIQVLTDLDLVISKAYISSDGGWFMDVFHVTDRLGQKLTNEKIIGYIRKALGAQLEAERAQTITQVETCLGRVVNMQSTDEHTVLELTGGDRPGLLSEITGVLKDLECNVSSAEVWTHNRRMGCLVYITDGNNGGPVKDLKKLQRMMEQLTLVLNVVGDSRASLASGSIYTERRLHQMMLADGDYEPSTSASTDVERPSILVEQCSERRYTVVTLKCKDRPKLLFDTICTLTDLQYVIFHAAVYSDASDAFQEYYIRDKKDFVLSTEAEEHIVRCLEAAIERRVSPGFRLEICTSDRIGLLSDVTRVFRERGLSITRADVATHGNKAVNVFYVTDVSGKPVGMDVIDSIRQELEQARLELKSIPEVFAKPPTPEITIPKYWLGSLFTQSGWLLSNLGLIRSS